MKIVRLWVACGLTALVAVGCGKTEEPEAPAPDTAAAENTKNWQPEVAGQGDHAGHDHAAHAGHDHAAHEGHDHGAHEGHDHAAHEGHDHGPEKKPVAKKGGCQASCCPK